MIYISIIAIVLSLCVIGWTLFITNKKIQQKEKQIEMERENNAKKSTQVIIKSYEDKERIETGSGRSDFDASIDVLHNLATNKD